MTKASDISGLLARLYPVVRQEIKPLHGDGPAYVLFFSISDGRERAAVFTAAGQDIGTVWRRGARQAENHARSDGPARAWLRVDWVENIEEKSWSELQASLATTKRNYFRYGIALDRRFRHAFLEMELNANAMLYGGSKIPHCVVNEANFRRYAKRRHGLPTVDFAEENRVWTFSTAGVFTSSEEDEVRRLHGAGRNAGRREIEALTAADVLGLVTRASQYLSAQVREQGRFRYGWHPCFGREISAYNALRHASSLYAMIEAWELTQDTSLKAAIDRSLAYLTTSLIRRIELPDGERVAFLVDEGDEIKLGGNAVCLLALVKYSELTGSQAYGSLLEELALGILRMQDRQTGRFSHVLHYPSLEVKEEFRIIYYDGEAAFGLMRLFAFTRDPRWIEAVERAFVHFIRNEHWKANDHWLGYCVNELTRFRPEMRYFEFGIRNFETHLDFVIERITTFPTLLELMMASRRMLDRLEARPDGRQLLGRVDLAKFQHALNSRAHYMLNGHFWPELAMFFKDPDEIVGSFFIRHHAFRVRIDDVEHYLSGYVAYWKYLNGVSPSPQQASVPCDETPGQSRSGWTANEVEAATGGQWEAAPSSPAWQATGLSIWSPTFRAGDMVVVRSGDGPGIPAEKLQRLPAVPQALIAERKTDLPSLALPVLRVDDASKAVLDLGAFARLRMTGKVIGVTGSAGKTTLVAMLARILESSGDVGYTRHNANLPRGIAWNLASMPRDVPFAVLEMAIGRMKQNSLLARPDIALVTNVAAAHLKYHGSVQEVARRKAQIFEGMKAGGFAVIHRDMAEWRIFSDAAIERGLHILSYGQDSQADIRLMDYDLVTGEAQASIRGKEVRFACGAAGRHMALNVLGCLAVLEVLELPINLALATLTSFRALDGRGAIIDATLDTRRLRLIDETYNANPASMQAAIPLLLQVVPPLGNGRRVLILGDMLELGPGSPAYHARLAPVVEGVSPDLVLLCGTEMAALRDALPAGLACRWVPDIDQLIELADALLSDGDVVLVKSSASSGLSTLMEALKTGTLRETPLKNGSIR